MGILGVPTTPHKVEGSSTRLTCPGIELHTTTLTACLPDDKLHHLISTLQAGVWETVPDTRTPIAERGSTACLCHCSGWKSIPAQHDRALQDCQGSASPQLPQLGVQADLQWWRAFTLTRNGRCVLLPALQATPDEEGFTDVFGSWGCGGMWQKEWF